MLTKSITELTNAVLAFVPRLAGALLILIVGWFIGSIAAWLITRVANRIKIDKVVLATPVGEILSGTEKAVSGTFEALDKWFVCAIAVLAIADMLAVDLFSGWVSITVSYAPSFMAGLFVIVLGFVIADFIGDAITRTRATTEAPYTNVFAVGARMFLYFIAVVIGLSTMGINVAVLFTIAQAFAWSITAALAIGIGGTIAFGAHNYVSTSVERWMGSTRSVATTPVSPMGDDTDSPEGASSADD